MILLIAQASKNAILIVEFAKDLHENGVETQEAAAQTILALKAVSKSSEKDIGKRRRLFSP